MKIQTIQLMVSSLKQAEFFFIETLTYLFSFSEASPAPPAKIRGPYIL